MHLGQVQDGWFGRESSEDWNAENQQFWELADEAEPLWGSWEENWLVQICVSPARFLQHEVLELFQQTQRCSMQWGSIWFVHFLRKLRQHSWSCRLCQQRAECVLRFLAALGES